MQPEFTKLYADYYPHILQYCYYFFKNPWDGEELAQEVFVKAWQADWTTIDQPARLAWLLKIAHNLCIDRYRSIKRFKKLLYGLVYEDSSSLPETAYLLHKTILKLPLAQREIFIMRHVLDLSTEEVAETLNLSTGTVKSQLSRALLTLKLKCK